MKKLIAIMLVAILALNLCACGSTDGGGDTDEKVYQMTIAHSQPDTNPRAISLEKFKEDVEEMSDGRIEVTIIGGGQLGSEPEMLEQVVAGTIQGMRGGHLDFNPRLLMFTLPFLAEDRADVDALLNSEIAQTLIAENTENTETVLIDISDAGGFRQLSNNDAPIKSPEDLEGLKIRTTATMTADGAFKAMGATTVSVPYGELYMGLSTGVADGQENPWVNVEGMAFYEVQKYFTQTNYQFLPDPFYVNKTWWNELPADLQEIVSECAVASGDYNDQLCDEQMEGAKQTILDYGCEIYVPTDEEMQAFKDAVQPVYQECIDAGILTQAELDELLSIVENN